MRFFAVVVVALLVCTQGVEAQRVLAVDFQELQLRAGSPGFENLDIETFIGYIEKASRESADVADSTSDEDPLVTDDHPLVTHVIVADEGDFPRYNSAEVFVKGDSEQRTLAKPFANVIIDERKVVLFCQNCGNEGRGSYIVNHDGGGTGEQGQWVRFVRNKVPQMKDMETVKIAMRNALVLTRDDLMVIRWILWAGGDTVRELRREFTEFFKPSERRWFLRAVMDGLPMLVTGLETGTIDLVILHPLKTDELPSLRVSSDNRGFLIKVRNLVAESRLDLEVSVELRLGLRAVGFSLKKSGRETQSNSDRQDMATGQEELADYMDVSIKGRKKSGCELGDWAVDRYGVGFSGKCSLEAMNYSFVEISMSRGAEQGYSLYSARSFDSRSNLSFDMPRLRDFFDGIFIGEGPGGVGSPWLHVNVPVLKLVDSKLEADSFLEYKLPVNSVRPLRGADRVFSQMDECFERSGCGLLLGEVNDYLYFSGNELPELSSRDLTEGLRRLRNSSGPLVEVLEDLWARVRAAVELHRNVKIRLVERKLVEKHRARDSFATYLDYKDDEPHDPRLEYLLRGLQHQKARLAESGRITASVLPHHPCPQSRGQIQVIELVSRPVLTQSELGILEIEVVPMSCQQDSRY